MDNKVKLPIKTTRNGNRITKVCVEDVYRMVNSVVNNLEYARCNILDFLDSIYNEYDGYEGHFIVGTGNSQPCITDAFDEEIGNNIAFMKAKLNANMKKHNLLRKILKQLYKATREIEKEICRVDNYIDMDIDGIRKYNPEYLIKKH